MSGFTLLLSLVSSSDRGPRFSLHQQYILRKSCGRVLAIKLLFREDQRHLIVERIFIQATRSKSMQATYDYLSQYTITS